MAKFLSFDFYPKAFYIECKFLTDQLNRWGLYLGKSDVIYSLA